MDDDHYNLEHKLSLQADDDGEKGSVNIISDG